MANPDLALGGIPRRKVRREVRVMRAAPHAGGRLMRQSNAPATAITADTPADVVVVIGSLVISLKKNIVSGTRAMESATLVTARSRPLIATNSARDQK